MDTKKSIRKMIELSIEKLSLMRKKSKVLSEEVRATQEESVEHLDAIDQMKHVLEDKLLQLDIEFLKFYGNVLEREGISDLSDMDIEDRLTVRDLQTVVGKIQEVESRVLTTEQEVVNLRQEHERTLGPKRRLKKMGGQASMAYNRQKQVSR